MFFNPFEVKPGFNYMRSAKPPPILAVFWGGFAFRSKIINFWDIDKIFETEKLDRVSDMEKNFGQHLVNTCWLIPISKNFIVEKRPKIAKNRKTFFSKVSNSVSRDFSHGWWVLKSCLRCWRTFLNHQWSFEKKSCIFFNLMIFEKKQFWRS